MFNNFILHYYEIYIFNVVYLFLIIVNWDHILNYFIFYLNYFFLTIIYILII